MGGPASLPVLITLATEEGSRPTHRDLRWQPVPAGRWRPTPRWVLVLDRGHARRRVLVVPRPAPRLRTWPPTCAPGFRSWALA